MKSQEKTEEDFLLKIVARIFFYFLWLAQKLKKRKRKLGKGKRKGRGKIRKKEGLAFVCKFVFDDGSWSLDWRRAWHEDDEEEDEEEEAA